MGRLLESDEELEAAFNVVRGSMFNVLGGTPQDEFEEIAELYRSVDKLFEHYLFLAYIDASRR